MNIIGLIAEYNPLHNGHIYQLKKIKELYPKSTIIVVTNSCFTQRGDVSILNKWDKTKLCLENDIDLVIELPFAYATQSADIFAKGALTILNYLHIDTLVFGSESNDIEKLTKIAQTQLNNPNYDTIVQKYLDTGINYPTALSKALTDILGFSTIEPNDLLAISYLKEIIQNNYPITPISIKRLGSYHDKKASSSITNASLIRELFLNKETITKYLPSDYTKYLYSNLSLESYFPYLKYKIISSPNLEIYQTVDEGIENRIKKVINNVSSWQELAQAVKTKRYTYNKVNRMLIHILTSFTKEEAQSMNIDYIRLLGFSEQGQIHLNKIKKNLHLPIITHYKPNISPLLDLEFRITNIYHYPHDYQGQKNIEKEYKQKPLQSFSKET